MKEVVKLKPLISREYTKTHLMNPEKKYTNSLHTNISERKEFKKVRKAIAEQRKEMRAK